jgi:16S rRNA (cytosine967-C5)-methyltransferase
VWAAWWQARGAVVPDLPELSAVPREPTTNTRSLEAAPPAIRASLPDWLDQTGAAALGDGWPALRNALNEPADVWLRANTLRTSSSGLIDALAREGVTATAATAGGRRPDALRLPSRQRLADTAAFRAGLFEVQDAGSQEIAPFLQARPGDFVIDSCAGAGGKSLHLAALMHNEGRLLALDIHPWKLAALEKRAARAGITCLHRQTIGSQQDLAQHAGSADRLLIDAPCSGLGVLRRHPDTKWKLSPAELDRLVRLQAELLDSHSTMLKPGGTLVYATCSFLPQENSGQIRAFLSRQPAGAWSLEDERLLLPAPADPDANHDAFYMARLRRTAP